MKEILWLAWMCILVFACIVGIGAIGWDAGRDSTRRQAIEAGAARWAIDEKTGEKSFVWGVKP